MCPFLKNTYSNKRDSLTCISRCTPPKSIGATSFDHWLPFIFICQARTILKKCQQMKRASSSAIQVPFSISRQIKKVLLPSFVFNARYYNPFKFSPSNSTGILINRFVPHPPHKISRIKTNTSSGSFVLTDMVALSSKAFLFPFTLSTMNYSWTHRWSLTLLRLPGRYSKTVMGTGLSFTLIQCILNVL